MPVSTPTPLKVWALTWAGRSEGLAQPSQDAPPHSPITTPALGGWIPLRVLAPASSLSPNGGRRPDPFATHRPSETARRSDPLRVRAVAPPADLSRAGAQPA